MGEGDYAYYGAPYGYEEIYQAAYPLAQNGRVPFYPDAYQAAGIQQQGYEILRRKKNFWGLKIFHPGLN